jgi:hypothetical protein
MTSNSKRERAIRRLMNYHEAGHAVAARLLGVEIVAIDMTKSGASAAHVLTRSAAHAADPGDATAHAVGLHADLQVALAGGIAQQLAGYPANSDDVDDGDMANAGNAVGMLALLDAGLSANPGPGESRELSPGDPLHSAALDFGERAHVETVALLRANWLAVVRVAAALGKSDRLEPADIDRVIANGQRSSGDG